MLSTNVLKLASLLKHAADNPTYTKFVSELQSVATHEVQTDWSDQDEGVLHITVPVEIDELREFEDFETPEVDEEERRRGQIEAICKKPEFAAHIDGEPSFEPAYPPYVLIHWKF